MRHLLLVKCVLYTQSGYGSTSILSAEKNTLFQVFDHKYQITRSEMNLSKHKSKNDSNDEPINYS